MGLNPIGIPLMKCISLWQLEYFRWLQAGTIGEGFLMIGICVGQTCGTWPGCWVYIVKNGGNDIQNLGFFRD